MKSKKTGRVVTPDDLARKWWGKTIRHSHQQWAYLQLARLEAKGLIRRTQRGRYVIKATGVRKTKAKAA